MFTSCSTSIGKISLHTYTFNRARVSTNHLNFACHIIYSIGACQVVLLYSTGIFRIQDDVLMYTIISSKFRANFKKKKKKESSDTGKKSTKI